MFTPSIFTIPSGSVVRNRVAITELFPAPVRPTIPIYNEITEVHRGGSTLIAIAIKFISIKIKNNFLNHRKIV